MVGLSQTMTMDEINDTTMLQLYTKERERERESYPCRITHAIILTYVRTLCYVVFSFLFFFFFQPLKLAKISSRERISLSILHVVMVTAEKIKKKILSNYLYRNVIQ